ncbi:MAG: hypothetical protein LBT20_03995 [Clostridiales bacterium]|jgi:hypothetical protein|nr:hypothetical protein [Clostridiales bacterium]
MDIKNPTIKALWDRANWKGQAHGKSPKILGLFMLLPIIALILGMCFSGGKEEILLGCGVGIIIYAVIIIVVMRKIQWNNSILIFAADNEGIYFTNADSKRATWFQDSYSNIAGYQYTKNDDATGTFVILLKTRSNAGKVYGNLKKLKMIKVDHPDGLKQILDQKRIPNIK